MPQNHKRALVIVKNSEIFYVEEKATKIVKLINQPYLEDLETIDSDVLTKSLSLWKEKNKGIKLHILIIFSDEVLFEKTFKNDDQEIEEKVNHYLDKVPFDRLISRHYERKNETDFVVINRDFYEEIVDCFENNGFEVVNTLPEQLIKSVIKFEDFNAEAAKKILQKFDAFKNPKLSLNNKSMTKIKKKYQAEAKSKATLIILAGVFSVLVVMFLFILFMQSYFNNRTVSNTEIFQKQIVLPTVPDQKDLLKEKLNIEISYTRDASESAGLLKKNLETDKFKNISLKLSYQYINNPEIIFPNNLSEDIQNEIIGRIEGISQSLLIKHDEKTENIISISL